MYWHQIEIREIRETFLKNIKKMMSYGSALNRNWDYKKQLLKLSDEFASNQIKSNRYSWNQRKAINIKSLSVVSLEKIQNRYNTDSEISSCRSVKSDTVTQLVSCIDSFRVQ